MAIEFLRSYFRKNTPSKRKVLFEPWHLGDVIIAAATFRAMPENLAIACAQKYYSVLKNIVPTIMPSQMILISADHTDGKGNKFKFSAPIQIFNDDVEVLSIRGDVRDLILAKRTFPAAKIRFYGWVAFFARRSAMANALVLLLRYPVKNRYEYWAETAGVPFDAIKSSYLSQQNRGVRNETQIGVYIGARYPSKYYPHYRQLILDLQRDGYKVAPVAFSREEADYYDFPVEVMKSDELIEFMKCCRYVISGDTGPMHLAAFLGCKTFVIGHISNIKEWLPPLAGAISSSTCPVGYRPRPEYETSAAVPGWPEASEVQSAFYEWIKQSP